MRFPCPALQRPVIIVHEAARLVADPSRLINARQRPAPVAAAAPKKGFFGGKAPAQAAGNMFKEDTHVADYWTSNPSGNGETARRKSNSLPCRA